MKKQVLFKSLLDEEEPLQRGILDEETGFVECLCGCNGCFEPGDYEIIGTKQNKGDMNMGKSVLIKTLVQQQVIQSFDAEKLEAVVEFAKAETDQEIAGLAEYLNSFDFIEGIKSYAAYGEHLFCRETGLSPLDLDDMVLKKYIDFEGYGKHKMAGEPCGFTSLGFVECICDLEKIMENIRRK